MTLCFDITQFAHQPYASGIQRVLLQIATACEDADRFVVRGAEGLSVITPSVAEFSLRSLFEGSDARGQLIDHFSHRGLGTISENEALAMDWFYVIPELSFQPDLVRWWEHLARERPDRVGAIFYDAAPEMNRQMFGGPPPPGASAYFRLMARIDKVACISSGARTELSQLGRRDPTTIDVVPLGGDHLPTEYSDDQRRFIVIGDLKTKKRVDVALSAFQSVADHMDHELVIIGRHISGEDHIADTVASAVGPRVRWLQNATDQTLAVELAGASATIFIATAEGFGLPALESIHAGVPLVADASLPALEYLRPGGQIQLPDVTVTSVAEALVTAAGPRGGELRVEARANPVPTWSAYVERLRALFTGR